MRVLLTGAAGFVGTAVGRLAREAGHDVVRLDALLPQAHGPGRSGDDRRGDDGLHRVDVRDTDAVRPLLAGVDAVCHQAALVGVETSAADLPSYAAANDLGTATLLALMAERGVGRLVLASSMVVYGEGRYRCAAHGTQPAPPRRVADLEAGVFDHRCPVCGEPLAWALVGEDARLEPRSGYAASKVAQEHYGAAWARQTEGSVVALRYHNVYGPGMPRDTPYSGVAAMFRSSLERGEPPPVFEDGAQTRDFVHVDDVARANLLALEAEPAAGTLAAYNVCSGIPVTIAEVARLVAAGALADLEPVVTGEYRPGDVRHVVASPERAATRLGFRASVAPAEGLPAFATAPLR